MARAAARSKQTHTLLRAFRFDPSRILHKLISKLLSAATASPATQGAHSGGSDCPIHSGCSSLWLSRRVHVLIRTSNPSPSLCFSALCSACPGRSSLPGQVQIRRSSSRPACSYLPEGHLARLVARGHRSRSGSHPLDYQILQKASSPDWSPETRVSTGPAASARTLWLWQNSASLGAGLSEPSRQRRTICTTRGYY